MRAVIHELKKEFALYPTVADLFLSTFEKKFEGGQLFSDVKVLMDADLSHKNLFMINSNIAIQRGSVSLLVPLFNNGNEAALCDQSIAMAKKYSMDLTFSHKSIHKNYFESLNRFSISNCHDPYIVFPYLHYEETDRLNYSDHWVRLARAQGIEAISVLDTSIRSLSNYLADVLCCYPETMIAIEPQIFKNFFKRWAIKGLKKKLGFDLLFFVTDQLDQKVNSHPASELDKMAMGY